jgi:hypothetical protein
MSCVAGRLPLKDGIAQIDRSIALETNKFGASVSGNRKSLGADSRSRAELSAVAGWRLPTARNVMLLSFDRRRSRKNIRDSCTSRPQGWAKEGYGDDAVIACAPQ